jgi:hypothetical protein
MDAFCQVLLHLRQHQLMQREQAPEKRLTLFRSRPSGGNQKRFCRQVSCLTRGDQEVTESSVGAHSMGALAINMLNLCNWCWSADCCRIKEAHWWVQAVIIPDGAHHLDLMFSNPEDPLTVRVARKIELDNIQRWIDEFHET